MREGEGRDVLKLEGKVVNGGKGRDKMLGNCFLVIKTELKWLKKILPR